MKIIHIYWNYPVCYTKSNRVAYCWSVLIHWMVWSLTSINRFNKVWINYMIFMIKNNFSHFLFVLQIWSSTSFRKQITYHTNLTTSAYIKHLIKKIYSDIQRWNGLQMSLKGFIQLNSASSSFTYLFIFMIPIITPTQLLQIYLER